MRELPTQALPPSQLRETQQKTVSTSEGTFPIRDAYVYLFVSASIVTLAILGYPVYFRSDDIGYFTWVKAHPNFLDCFTPGVNYLFAGHRPITIAYWWIVFNLFGMDQTIYQIVMPTLLILSMIFLHKLSKLLFGARAGLFTVLVFLLVFNRYFNVLFWYSNINNLMEPTLAVIACYFIAHSFGSGSLASKLLACLFSMSAIFTKEPSMGIISAFSVGLLLSCRARLRSWRRYVFLVPIFAIVVYQFLITPAWTIRFASRAQITVARLTDNYLFYVDSLSSGFLGFIVMVLFFYLLISSLCLRLSAATGRSKPRLWESPLFLLLVSVGLSLVDPALLHLPFLVGLLAVLWLAFRRERRYLPFVLWFAVVFVFLLALKNQVNTNLFNSTYGLAVLLGLSAERLYGHMKVYLPGVLKSRKAQAAGLVVTAILVAVLAGNQIAHQYRALRALKNTRGNFRDVTEFIVANLPRNAQLFLIDYGTLGWDYRRAVTKGDLTEKARFHKTMRIEYMGPLLALSGRPDITVRPLKEIAGGQDSLSYALPANLRENTFLKQLLEQHSITAQTLFEVGRGADSAYVYKLTPSQRASESLPTQGTQFAGR